MDYEAISMVNAKFFAGLEIRAQFHVKDPENKYSIT
jgi:hypothetical protein